ncbi:MAG TPA: cytochrome P450 [Kineosporiaceae bacterium]|nr:cytochrome P450 [Kineosporiaceae bacterium]
MSSSTVDLDQVGLEQIDLTDVDLFVRGDHPEVFSRLRRSRPVHENISGNERFIALTRYDDVLWAYRNHELFGSTRGAILGGSFGRSEDSAAGRMLVASDLPGHRLLKQHIQAALSGSVTARIREQIGRLLERAIGQAIADGGCDFATQIATELPAGALMVVMGIGHADAHHLIGLTRRMVGFRDEVFVDTGGDVRLRLAWLQAEIFEFFADLLAERRRQPGDDLISLLLRAQLNGRPMGDEEILYNCMNVAVGGNETSSYTACTGMLALMEHPAQYELLRSSPALLDSAIEEMLRYSSTNAYVQRVARRDTVRHGVPIREGDSVTLWNFSANRDEDQFPDAACFDVTRSPNRHLSYGSGLHRCIGAPIAQAELALLFRRLLAAPVRWRPAGQARRLRSNFILGITELPVEVG